MTPEQRFRRHIRVDSVSGCHVWTGFLNQGYGWFWVKGGPVFAYRWAYQRAHGAIPDGLHLDHLCRNKACCNPAHLEPVTPQTNCLRGLAPAAVNARKTHCIRGHEFTPENTRMEGHRRRCKACRAERNANARLLRNQAGD